MITDSAVKFSDSDARPISLVSYPTMDTLRSIRTLDQDKIDIVNQLLLPHTIEYVQIQTIEQAHDAIKSMKVFFLSFIAHSTH
jgi:hypothetical protein